MSYGASLWLSGNGRARAAASAKGRAKKKKPARSARPAKKKRKPSVSKARAKKKPKGSTSRTKKKSAKRRPAKPKAAKLYTRYDPVTGKSARVTQDDYRYEEWSSRKLTKKAREKKLLRDDPLKYVTDVGVEHVAKKAGTTAIRRAKTAAKKGLNVGRFLTPGVVGAGVAITSALAGLAGAFVLGEQIAKNGRLAHGERVRQLSLRFVEIQKSLIRQFHGTQWSDVPEQVRKKAVSDYTRQLALAATQAQGVAYVGGRPEGSYK